MEDAKNKETKEFGIKGALFYYFIGLSVFIGIYYLLYLLTVVGIIAESAKWPLLIILTAYVAVGIFLSKTILKKIIEWHPMYNTISNVAKAKIKQLLFWPITYPILIFQLIIHDKL